MGLFSIGEIESYEPENKSKKAKVKALKEKNLLLRANEKLKIISIDKGEAVHFVSMGDWSTHNLVEHLLKTTGPATVYAATWSVTENPIRQLMRLADAGKIKELNLVIDWRVKVRCPQSLQLSRAAFANVRAANCHAKATVIQNKDWNISIIGSANYTNNPRIEAGVITESKQIANFHKDWIMAEINNADPFEAKKRGK